MVILHACTRNMLFGSSVPSVTGWKQCVLLTNTNRDSITIGEDILGNGFILRLAHLFNLIFSKPFPSSCNSEYMVTLSPSWAAMSSYGHIQPVPCRSLRFQNCSVWIQAMSEVSRFHFHLTLPSTPADKSYDHWKINYFYSHSLFLRQWVFMHQPLSSHSGKNKNWLVLGMQLPPPTASCSPCSKDVHGGWGNYKKHCSVGYTPISNVNLNHWRIWCLPPLMRNTWIIPPVSYSLCEHSGAPVPN